MNESLFQSRVKASLSLPLTVALPISLFFYYSDLILKQILLILYKKRLSYTVLSIQQPINWTQKGYTYIRNLIQITINFHFNNWIKWIEHDHKKWEPESQKPFKFDAINRIIECLVQFLSMACEKGALNFMTSFRRFFFCIATLGPLRFVGYFLVSILPQNCVTRAQFKYFLWIVFFFRAEEVKQIKPDDGRRRVRTKKDENINGYKFLWCVCGLQFQFRLKTFIVCFHIEWFEVGIFLFLFAFGDPFILMGFFFFCHIVCLNGHFAESVPNAWIHKCHDSLNGVPAWLEVRRGADWKGFTSNNKILE